MPLVNWSILTSLRIRQATRNERIYQNRTRYYDIYRVARNFLRVLIFAVFTIFPAVRKNKNLPQTFFLAKINSRVNILKIKFTTQKHSITKSCLFNYNLPLSSRNKTVYIELLILHRVRIPQYCLKLCISIVSTYQERKYC